MANDIGDLRRSAVAFTYGPGAIVDFRAGQAAISALAAGIEEWDAHFPPSGMLNPQAVHEVRLEKKLNVKGFRLPPVRDPSQDADKRKALPAVRFPKWLQCPICDKIGPEKLWMDDPGKPVRWCPECSRGRPANRRVAVVPVRFVLACDHGHVDEFPWHFWCNHREGCENAQRKGFLLLRSEGAGLAGIVLSCPKCGARKSLDGLFGREMWKQLPLCSGRRPWLGGPDETCGRQFRVVQRGASNFYFPVTESALSIPPWSDRVQETLGVHWQNLLDIEDLDERRNYIQILSKNVLKAALADLRISPAGLATEIQRRLEARDSLNTDDLRSEEYRQFAGGAYVERLDREFEIRPQTVPDDIVVWISRLVKVVRLREVRALVGFTRINPPAGIGDPALAHVSANSQPDWLPAIEVRGEGVFMEFEIERLKQWEKQPEVRRRAATVNGRWLAEWRNRFGATAVPPRNITARFLLVHTFSHALMRQLTLDCGYSSAALRERLYTGPEGSDMAGLLIYTATTDEDGTLGGLQRQGDPSRMERTVQAALAAQEWCSSDPLCIEDLLTGEDSLSLAACHACVLAPETSCEEYNRFLDRAMLLGVPNDRSTGYFSELK